MEAHTYLRLTAIGAMMFGVVCKTGVPSLAAELMLYHTILPAIASVVETFDSPAFRDSNDHTSYIGSSTLEFVTSRNKTTISLTISEPEPNRPASPCSISFDSVLVVMEHDTGGGLIPMKT